MEEYSVEDRLKCVQFTPEVRHHRSMEGHVFSKLIIWVQFPVVARQHISIVEKFAHTECTRERNPLLARRYRSMVRLCGSYPQDVCSNQAVD